MRHAQKYWLEIQAKQAVEIAMQKSVKDDADQILIGTKDLKFVSGVRDLLLQDAAKQLIKAEILHRAMTQMDGYNNG